MRNSDGSDIRGLTPELVYKDKYKVDPSFLIITIYDVSQKEDVMGVYKEWKKEYFKRSSK